MKRIRPVKIRPVKETWEQRLERFTGICKTLILETKKLNNARDELRMEAELLAGCRLQEWSIEDIFRYVDLGREKYNLPIDTPPPTTP